MVSQTWRARLLWEVLRIGDLIAAPQPHITYEGEMANVIVEYARWYRPLIWLAFWIARPKV